MQGSRARYLGAIGAIIVATLIMYIQPQIARVAIDYAIDDKPLDAPPPVEWLVTTVGARSTWAKNLWIAAVLILGLRAVSGAFTYLKGRWSAVASESTARRLRDRLYDHLQHLPCTYHDRAETGDLVQRCSSDVETVRMFLAVQVVEIGRSGIMLGLALPFMLAVNAQMTLVSMVLLPVVVGFASVFFVRVRRQFQRADEAEGRMTAMLQENLTGIRVVRAFARQKFECDRFAGANADYRDRWFKLVRLLSVYWSTSDLLCLGQMALVLGWGAWLISRGQFTVGGLVAFFSYVNMFLWPVRHLGRVLADLGKATVSLERIQDILDHPADPEVASEPAPLPEAVQGRLTFEGVHFAFPGSDEHVLRDVSLTVEPGQTLAVLGPSGSGKSTLVSLLLRFYDVDRGRVLLDGVDVRRLPRSYVRRQIGVVLQEPFLYSKTVRENIGLGREGAGERDVHEAARIACVHDSIEQFDDAYDTLVGERGVTLSGGQRQRVALARAILADPPVMILDDALSAVDTRTESMILDALASRRGRHTTVVIAHRLSTLIRADRIIVLDAGRIVQAGSHRQLLNEDGLYRRLWRIQTDLEDDLRDDLASLAPSPTS
jgi:ATP-binding cassette subfamily B protein